jgi:CMP-N,N'-diacetyllegionaminic acid synthase
VDVLALVPARGGSKGIPRKNLAPIAGRPLLAWTVAAAQESNTVTRVVVSTDDAEIAATARALGAEVLNRPTQLGSDETPMRAVLDHAVVELGMVDVLVLLQPTSPLRRPEHIDEAVRLLLESDADCVISVVEVPHRFAPDSLMALDEGRLVPLGSSASRRQDKQPVYARNGPAVLAIRPDRLGDDLYGGECRPYVMRREESLDVDEPIDLELAEWLLSRR